MSESRMSSKSDFQDSEDFSKRASQLKIPKKIGEKILRLKPFNSTFDRSTWDESFLTFSIETIECLDHVKEILNNFVENYNVNIFFSNSNILIVENNWSVLTF